jgi:hypothetical protein
MDEDLKSKLRELVDRQEIWAVVLRYSRGIDRLDRELVRSCYWDDAIDDHYAYIGGTRLFYRHDVRRMSGHKCRPTPWCFEPLLRD